MTTKQPKWLEDFYKALKAIEPNYDKRQKIIQLFKTVLKEKQKEWENKHKKINQTPLL
jgi:hypothetical protein